MTIEALRTYLEGETIHTPLKLTWDMTNACNLSCPFCYIRANPPDPFIVFDKIREDLSDMIERGLLFATLSGGECTMVPDFYQIYQYLKERGVVVTVFSNGLNINESLIELWKELPPASLEVTLYSANTDSAAYRTLERLKEAGINVLGKVTITTVTADVLEPARRWCAKRGIDFICDGELFNGDNGVDAKEYMLGWDERIRLLEEKIGETVRTPKNAAPKYKRWYDCKAGTSGIYISPQYSLSTCFASPHRWSLADGFSAAYGQMVNHITSLKGKRISGCSGCSYFDLCTVCGPVLERRFGIGAGSYVPADVCEGIKKRFGFLG